MALRTRSAHGGQWSHCGPASRFVMSFSWWRFTRWMIGVHLDHNISQLISCLATQIVWFNMVQWVNNEFSRHIYGGISDGDGPKTLGHEVMKWYCFGVNLQHVSSPLRRRSESTQQTLSRNVQVLKVVSRIAPRGEVVSFTGNDQTFKVLLDACDEKRVLQVRDKSQSLGISWWEPPQAITFFSILFRFM